jgi:hypothetical protein
VSIAPTPVADFDADLPADTVHVVAAVMSPIRTSLASYFDVATMNREYSQEVQAEVTILTLHRDGAELLAWSVDALLEAAAGEASQQYPKHSYYAVVFKRVLDGLTWATSAAGGPIHSIVTSLRLSIATSLYGSAQYVTYAVRLLRVSRDCRWRKERRRKLRMHWGCRDALSYRHPSARYTYSCACLAPPAGATAALAAAGCGPFACPPRRAAA